MRDMTKLEEAGQVLKLSSTENVEKKKPKKNNELKEKENEEIKKD